MGRGTGLLATVLVAVAAFAAGCGSGSLNQHPVGAESSRSAVSTFFEGLEHRDGDAMRRLMTPMAQRNESIGGGLLQDTPKLTSFKVLRVARENPKTNASPTGSVASLRYTVSLTPAEGFDNDNTSGTSYLVLVSETRDRRWLVAELGGCC